MREGSEVLNHDEGDSAGGHGDGVLPYLSPHGVALMRDFLWFPLEGNDR